MSADSVRSPALPLQHLGTSRTQHLPERYHGSVAAMAYPVSLHVEPALTNRNRLTTAFRLILAIPHLILVGGGLDLAVHSRGGRSAGLQGGLLGAVAGVLAIISWFTILFGGTHFAGIRQFTAFYLRWRARAMAYMMLLADPYPPFGDGPYPVTFEIVDPAGPRNRLSVAFRLIMAIPHFVVLVFILIAAAVLTVIAWFAILFTGNYPAAFHDFAVGAMRWELRVEAYVYLMVDEYPPFALS
jgi:hypothetical protein